MSRNDLAYLKHPSQMTQYDCAAPPDDARVCDLFDLTPTPLIVIHTETQGILRVNVAAISFYGHSRSKFLRLGLSDIRMTDGAADPASEWLLERAGVIDYHVTSTGLQRVVKLNVSQIVYEGQPAILAAIFDVTGEKDLQREVRAARSFLNNLVENVPVALFAKDAATGEFIFYNSAAAELFGVCRSDFIGRTSATVFGAEEAAKFVEQDTLTLQAGPQGIVSETVIPDRGGGSRCIRMKKVAVSDGEIHGRRYILAVAEDVTAERARQAEIAHLASHDSLTGLANRWLLLKRLEEMRERPHAASTRAAIHYIDLDGFKMANDTWGHSVGDKILSMAAERMRAASRHDDLVARLGGDEFVVLQSNVESVTEVVELAERLVDLLAEPYHLDGMSCNVSASVGVCSASQSTPAELIIDEADQALYVAKRDGKRRYAMAKAAI